jgi:hypothetical protein
MIFADGHAKSTDLDTTVGGKPPVVWTVDDAPLSAGQTATIAGVIRYGEAQTKREEGIH